MATPSVVSPIAPFIRIQKESSVALLASTLMTPLMYLAAGTLVESPQQTHRWNNRRLSDEELARLIPEFMAFCKEDPSACAPWFLGFPRFQVPILGGWRWYAVIEPMRHMDRSWHPGWVSGRFAGVSSLTVRGPVRLLLGPRPVSFFGVDSESNRQIRVCHVMDGRIGDEEPFCRAPLF